MGTGRVAGWLTVAEVAARLRISTEWLRGRIRDRAIRTVREPSGRYLFPDDEGALEALRQLRARAVKRIELIPCALQNEGHHHA